MIVPQTRLLLWVSVVVLPFAALAALVSETAVLASLLIVGVIVLALLDAALAQSSLEGISVELPQVVGEEFRRIHSFGLVAFTRAAQVDVMQVKCFA